VAVSVSDVSKGASSSFSPSRRLVVKLGGEVLEPPLLAAVAADLTRLAARGARFIVVHGGGPQATALSQRLGLVPRLVAGRRVTDEATLEVVTMVLAGQLNVRLVTALQAAGLDAVGLAGTSGIVHARRRPPTVMSGAGPEPVDFGWVGDVERFAFGSVDALLEVGAVPVVACLGLGPGGQVLNINGDTVASQMAAAWKAEALIAVTGVGGVRRDKDDPSSRLGRLTASEARAAIHSGVVQGGMIAKLEEALHPLAAGVAEVVIVGPGEIVRALEAPGSVGTTLAKDPA
jgi:acetylglutamate kinase